MKLTPKERVIRKIIKQLIKKKKRKKKNKKILVIMNQIMKMKRSNYRQ